MTSRQFALEVPVVGKDEISKVLAQAANLVQQAAQAIQQELNQVSDAIEETGDAAEVAGQQVRRSLAQGFREAGQSLRSAGKSISNAGQQLTQNLTIPLAAAGLAMQRFNDVAASLQVEATFRQMAERVGVSAAQMMSAVRSASAGIVDDTTLQAATSRAVAIGASRDMEQIATLWRLARVQSRELGITATQAFEQMSEAVAGASIETLKTQGFTLDTATIFEEYARSVGVSASELDLATQRQVVLNAVLEQGRQKLAQVDESALTEAESLQRMQAELSNTTDELLRSLLPAMQAVLGAFNALPGPVKTGTILLVGLGLAAGPVASAIGVLTSGVGLAVQGIGLLVAAESRAMVASKLYTAHTWLASVATHAFAVAQKVAVVAMRLTSIAIRGALISSGIGLVVVALTLLVLHWDTVWGVIKKTTQVVVDFVKAHWEKLLLFLGPTGWLIAGLIQVWRNWDKIWNGIKSTTAKIVNPIIGIINNLIDAMNKIPGVNLGHVPTIGGSQSSGGEVPALARGALVRRPTLALVGERGPELVTPLSQVGSLGRTIVINNDFRGLVVRDDSDVDRIAHRVRAAMEGAR